MEEVFRLNRDKYFLVRKNQSFRFFFEAPINFHGLLGLSSLNHKFLMSSIRYLLDHLSRGTS